jgi:hypothetical protein
MRYLECREHLDGGRHDFEVTAASHDDTDER